MKRLIFFIFHDLSKLARLYRNIRKKLGKIRKKQEKIRTNYFAIITIGILSASDFKLKLHIARTKDKDLEEINSLNEIISFAKVLF